MRKLLKLIFPTVIFVPALFAQTSFVRSLSGWYFKGTLPTTATAVISSTTKIEQINLSNVSASNVTITITDNGTDCNGGPCSVIPAVTIAGNSKYTIDLNGEVATRGILWSASIANSVHGFVRGSN